MADKIKFQPRRSGQHNMIKTVETICRTATIAPLSTTRCDQSVTSISVNHTADAPQELTE
jgi:hypothetical protein